MPATTPVVSDGSTRLAHILGVPLAADVDRQWPQVQEVVHGRDLVAAVDGSFPELTLAVGRRHHLGDVLVVEWSCDYGDGRIYRSASPSCARASPSASPTTGVDPPPPRSGAAR